MIPKGRPPLGARTARWLPALLLAGGLLAACSQLPPLEGRSESSALQDTQDTRLGRAVQALVRAHPAGSGVVPLVAGHDAFAARVALARAAQRSLDIQYYIWQQDLTGSLLMDAVRAAARRGVRVRLLLDDNNTSGLDAWLRAIDAEPNVEVRLFNPFPHRGLRALDYLGDFARVNRRMHNKSFTADNQVTLIGGRNVGDAYFAAGANLLFVDLDVLAVGSVVPEVSRDFDRYWASASAYPLAGLLPQEPPATVAPAPADAAAAEAYREGAGTGPGRGPAVDAAAAPGAPARRLDGELRWSTRQDGRVLRFDAEPHAGPWRRLAVRILSLLPIDGLL